MKFEITGIKEGVSHLFHYDNMTNVLSESGGYIFENKNIGERLNFGTESLPFSPENPLKKSRDVKTLKIQLGLSCNYSCEYCSQRFVEKADETSFKDISDFITKIDALNFSEKDGLKIELWGGEPFVYWKTIKPLVAALKEKFSSWEKKPRYSVITNGSILTEEIVEWLLDNMDGMAISHDGPGQWVRGPDPIMDEKEQGDRILELYRTVMSGTRHLKSMSFNAMLNAKNYSRKEIRQWFISYTGNPEVMMGEGSLVDAYDEGGIGLSLVTKQQHFDFRRTAFADIYGVSHDENIGWSTIIDKINFFIQSVLEHRESKFVSQKCGMDNEHTLAIDLRGDVLTCQNVSGIAINSNAEPHLSGNIANIEDVRITTSTHWRERKECSGCPVLHVCQGSCMFVTGEYWEHSCANAYSDALAIFALGFEKITGHIPVFIEGENLPDVRKDIFGTVLQHEEIIVAKKKPFPINVVSV